MTASNVASHAREASTDRTSHSRGSLESGLSRSHSGDTGAVSSGDFSRSPSNASGEAPKALRYHSSTSRGTLESSLSRSPSSRSGNFADVENSTESGISRSHGSGSFSQPDAYRGSRSRDNLEGGLSSSASRGISEGNLSRSQSNRSGGLTDSVFTRSEGASEGSLSRSHSGTSASFVEGGLSRSQSDENEECARPKLVRTSTAEDGGVPVGGLLRSSSRESSEGRFSRRQSDKNEGLSSRESGGYVEPAVSRTNSAEDGGVPVGGISRSHSETSRYRSEGNFARSQSDGAGPHSSSRREGYVEPTVSRTNSAEDGGVPVGGIPSSHSEVSRYSPDRSLPRLHGGEDVARSNHRREIYSEPTAYRTGRADDEDGLSRSHSEARRVISEGNYSRSLRELSEGFVDNSHPRAHSEGTQEGNLSSSNNNATSVESGVSRSHNDGARGSSVGSGFRTPSVTSTALTDSVFATTPCTADENAYEEMLSRVPSGATGNVPEGGRSTSRSADSEGPVETSTPICYSSRHDDAMERSLSRSHSGESRSFRAAGSYRSSSEASRGAPEGKHSRNDSYLAAVSHPRTYSSEAESPSGGIEAPVGSHEEGLSRTPSGGSASPGSTYLVGEVHSDNLHHAPAVEASYEGGFSTNE